MRVTGWFIATFLLLALAAALYFVVLIAAPTDSAKLLAGAGLATVVSVVLVWLGVRRP
jgi:multisubunit Na+/H+ antiporter MnhF subunit